MGGWIFLCFVFAWRAICIDSADYIKYWHQSEGIRPPFSCRIVSLELPYEENRDLRLCFTIFCCFVDYGVHLQVSRDYNKYWHQSEGIRPPFSCRIVSLELPYEGIAVVDTAVHHVDVRRIGYLVLCIQVYSAKGSVVMI
jgi:hypothetical protein